MDDEVRRIAEQLHTRCGGSTMHGPEAHLLDAEDVVDTVVALGWKPPQRDEGVTRERQRSLLLAQRRRLP